MSDKIKFVIIGSGNISNRYIEAIKNIAGSEVVGIVSRNMNATGKHKNIPSFRTLNDIDQNFDAIIICTPNGLHHVSAIEAAELHKHVLCEKPIDITIESIDKMIESCRKNNVKLGVTYQRRYSSDNPIVKKLIDENKLGKIFSVDLSVKNYRDDNYYNSSDYRGTNNIDGGGPFIQQASHYIDLYIWYFGSPNQVKSKLITAVCDLEVEDHGVVICSHNSGMIGTITASTATKPGFPAKLEIYTDKGYLIMENDIITHWDIEGLDNPSELTVVQKHTGASSALVSDSRNHEYIIKNFVESIRSGKDPLITGESAKKATELILNIYDNQIW